MKVRRIFLALTFFGLTLSGLTVLGLNKAHAHAVRAETLANDNTQVVSFVYATGDIPAYVQVEVFGPDNAEVEFQNGRTDALGRFAFTPDKAGLWAVVMSDGMGHKLRHELTVADVAGPANTGETGEGGNNIATAATAPRGTTGTEKAEGLPSVASWRALLGVSLLCNIFLGAAWWRRRATAQSANARV